MAGSYQEVINNQKPEVIQSLMKDFNIALERGIPIRGANITAPVPVPQTLAQVGQFFQAVRNIAWEGCEDEFDKKFDEAFGLKLESFLEDFGPLRESRVAEALAQPKPTAVASVGQGQGLEANPQLEQGGIPAQINRAFTEAADVLLNGDKDKPKELLFQYKNKLAALLKPAPKRKLEHKPEVTFAPKLTPH